MRDIEQEFLFKFRIEHEFAPQRNAYAFSVVEATEESNDAAHTAMSQALSAARGWIAGTAKLAMAIPAVVVDAPLFALVHATGGDEPLQPVKWSRVLWGETRAQTFVDVVGAEHVEAYGATLRESLDHANGTANMARMGHPPDV